MSANNQTLIKKHSDGKYYIFSNVNAESWDDVNILSIKRCEDSCSNFEDAYGIAEEIEKEEPTEYGIHKETLAKDGAKVVLI